VVDGQDVAEFVGRRAQGPAQAEGEVLPRIAVAVDGPDAGALPQAAGRQEEDCGGARPVMRYPSWEKAKITTLPSSAWYASTPWSGEGTRLFTTLCRDGDEREVSSFLFLWSQFPFLILNCWSSSSRAIGTNRMLNKICKTSSTCA
jgi:hypothetical protein